MLFRNQLFLEQKTTGLGHFARQRPEMHGIVIRHQRIILMHQLDEHIRPFTGRVIHPMCQLNMARVMCVNFSHPVLDALETNHRHRRHENHQNDDHGEACKDHAARIR